MAWWKGIMAFLAKTIDKLILDSNNKYSINVVIACAVNAKNSLHNCYGYSPNQLVFGHNPSLPSFLFNDLPAMEQSASDLLRKHLHAMSESRMLCQNLECEANEKLRRAIRSQVTPANSLIFQPGNHEFYIRNNENMWKGPGIVIGKENKQILVKHGGQYIRVHPCRLQLKSKNDQLNIQSVPACKFNNKPNEVNAVEPENKESNICEITDEEIVSVNNNMTNEGISDLTNSISNLSLKKEITESENSDN